MSLLKSHPFVVPVTTFLVLFFVTLAGFVANGGQVVGPSDSHVVRLHVDGEQQVVPTRAKTVGELLERRGIDVHEKDIIEPPLDTRITDDGFEINVYTARPVELNDKGVKTLVVSAHPNLEAVAEEAGITLNPEDKIEKAPTDTSEPAEILQEGLVAEKVIIKRAVPMKLSLFGVVYDIRTHSLTVGDLVRERGIEVKDVSVFPSLETSLQEGDLIVIAQPGKTISAVEETIPYTDQVISDSSLNQGQRRAQRQGRAGRRVLIYEVNPNGTQHLFQQVVLEHPVNGIVRVGTKALPAVGGTNAELLLALRTCETRSNYQSATGNGYYGAYQFSIPTWNSMGTGYPRADLAPPPVQDDAALRLAKRSGFHSQFPGCSRKLGLPAFPF